MIELMPHYEAPGYDTPEEATMAMIVSSEAFITSIEAYSNKMDQYSLSVKKWLDDREFLYG